MNDVANPPRRQVRINVIVRMIIVMGLLLQVMRAHGTRVLNRYGYEVRAHLRAGGLLLKRRWRRILRVVPVLLGLPVVQARSLLADYRVNTGVVAHDDGRDQVPSGNGLHAVVWDGFAH